MRKVVTTLILLSCLTPTSASATVYKCVATDGSVTYTNDRSLSRNCTQLSQDLPFSTIPAPSRPSPSGAPGATASPSSFPRVSPGTQRARDDTRRHILQTELESEQTALDTAQKALEDAQAMSDTEALGSYQDQIDLHQRNIDALQREIRSLR